MKQEPLEMADALPERWALKTLSKDRSTLRQPIPKNVTSTSLYGGVTLISNVLQRVLSGIGQNHLLNVQALAVIGQGLYSCNTQ